MSNLILHNLQLLYNSGYRLLVIDFDFVVVKNEISYTRKTLLQKDETLKFGGLGDKKSLSLSKFCNEECFQQLLTQSKVVGIQVAITSLSCNKIKDVFTKIFTDNE